MAVLASTPAPSTPYVGLARKYRPQNFADLVGQDQVANSLAQQVLQGTVAQAYMFCGPRGIGKTSVARILAKSVNCLEGGPTPTPCGKCEQCLSITSGNSMDVIEIDGASNNGIDDIRELQETINQNPFSARKKIYIIDEVHMLSKGAFNALLKTLEEPPPFVIFIFATTEFEKIPETIKSRCQSFQFSRISIENLIRRLDFVAQSEQIEMEPGERHGIFEAIAFAVDGGMRDAMMALDQLRALGDGSLRLDEVVRFLGVVEHDQLLRTVEMLHQRDARGLLEMVNALVERGRDLERFVKNLLSFLRDLMILKSGGGEGLVNLTGEKMERAKALLWARDERGHSSEVLSYAELLNFIQVFMRLEGEMKASVQVRIHLEFAFVKLTAIEPVVDIANLLRNFDRIAAAPPAARPAAPLPPDAAAPPPSASPAAVSQAPAPPQPTTPDLFGGAERRSDAPQASATAAPPVDAEALWSRALAQHQTLGVGLSVALRDCRCLGVEGDRLTLSLPTKSLTNACLSDPAKRAPLESLLTHLAGRPMRVAVQFADANAPRPRAQALRPSPVRAPAPMLLDSAPAPEAPAAESTGDASADAYALYLRQNPVARSREALKRPGPFRDQVAMVQQFFEGTILDTAGGEIALES